MLTPKKASANLKKNAPKILQNLMTRSKTLAQLDTSAELTKKQVQAVLGEAVQFMERHLQKRSEGQSTLSGLLDISVEIKPDKKAEKRI
ncbi:MAG: hypothetical protein P8176_09550 [Gammaproteobacteria bacterium]|jgi:nucleoid DNA-binding protein